MRLVAVFADAGMEQEVRSWHTHSSARFRKEGRDSAPTAMRQGSSIGTVREIGAPSVRIRSRHLSPIVKLPAASPLGLAFQSEWRRTDLHCRPVESEFCTCWEATVSIGDQSRVGLEPEKDEWARLEADLRGRFDVTAGRITWAGHTFDILRPKSVDDLINEEEFNRDGRLPYWADVWLSALGLADRIVKEQGDGRRLLELGCAVGFLSLLASKVGFQVTATDYYPEACDFTRLNAHRNGLSLSGARVVDWREYPE